MRTATRAAAALTAATMVLCAVAMQAQNVHYGESFELNSTLVPNESHEYYAGATILSWSRILITMLQVPMA